MSICFPFDVIDALVVLIHGLHEKNFSTILDKFIVVFNDDILIYYLN